jgi:hypothetical protein
MNNYVCCISCYCIISFISMHAFYFILRVGAVQSSNLFWIEMNLQTLKDLEIRKVFLFSIWLWAETRQHSDSGPAWAPFPPPAHGPVRDPAQPNQGPSAIVSLPDRTQPDPLAAESEPGSVFMPESAYFSELILSPLIYLMNRWSVELVTN